MSLKDCGLIRWSKKGMQVKDSQKIEKPEMEFQFESVTWTMDHFTWDPSWDSGTLDLQTLTQDKDEENES